MSVQEIDTTKHEPILSRIRYKEPTVRDIIAEQIVNRCRATRLRIQRGEERYPLRAALAALRDVQELAAADSETPRDKEPRQ